MAIFSAAAIAIIAASAVSAVSLNDLYPPPTPSSWPELDQKVFINGSYLNDALVKNAYDYVVSTVDSKYLNIKPSTYVQFGNVTYNDDPSANCYWGISNQCTRTANSTGIEAEITTCPSAKQWGITYDDGPVFGINPNSTDVDNALTNANIKATFFLIGINSYFWPDEVKKRYNAGHQIALHTWTHHPLTSLTNQQIVAEIRYSEAIIYNTIGKVPLFLRPPYGDIDDRVRAIATALGYKLAVWTTTSGFVRDTSDTSYANTVESAQTIVNTVTSWFTDSQSNTRGFISLEHENSNLTTTATVNALNVIAAWKKAGNFTLLPQPVGDCLGISYYKDWSSTSTNSTSTTSVRSFTSSSGSTTSSTSKTTSNAATPGGIVTAADSLARLLQTVIIGTFLVVLCMM